MSDGHSAEKDAPYEEPICSHCGGVGHTIGAHF